MTDIPREWAFLVYMAGDNGKVFDSLGRLMYGMEGAGHRDLKEMSAVGSTPQVAIVAQLDTLSDERNSYRVTIPAAGDAFELQSIPEQNTGNPQSLRDFIVWAVQSYPAKRYAVVLWNHGTGWKEEDIYAAAGKKKVDVQATPDEIRSIGPGSRLTSALFLTSALAVAGIPKPRIRAIAFDDSSMDFLDNRELKTAFQSAIARTGRRIDLLGMDACLMSMLEVAYQLRDTADVMVGSQEEEPMDGWPYTPILRSLINSPEMSANDLAAVIVEEYGNYFEANPTSIPITQSALDLRQVESLSQEMGKLAGQLVKQFKTEDIHLEAAVSRARRHVYRFKDSEYIDLLDFVTRLRREYQGDSRELRTYLDKTIDGIGSTPPFVLSNVAQGKHRDCAFGVSHYLPASGCSEFYSDLDYARFGWGDLICELNGIEKGGSDE